MKNKNLIGVFYALALVGLWAIASCTKHKSNLETLGGLSGQITDALSSLPLAGASIRIEGVNISKTTNSNAQGEYAFYDLNAGTYKLSVSLDKYGSAEKNIYVNAGGNTNLNIALTAEGAVVETREISDISSNAIKIKGYILSVGTDSITNYGFCWTKNAPPSIADDHNDLGKRTTKGEFEAKIENLEPSTTYSIRAYTVQNGNTFYSAVKKFTTSKSILPNLSLSASEFKMGKNVKTQTLDILNTVDNTDLTWSLDNIPPWLTVSSAQGTATLQNKSSVVLTVEDTVLFGKYTADLLVSSNGGDKQVKIIYDHTKAAQVETFEVTKSGNIFTAHGNIAFIGDEKLSAYGFCWAKNTSPTLADPHNNLGEKTKEGTFESKIDNIEPNTTYHIRAYATHEGGTFYGETKKFTTPNSLPPSLNLSAEEFKMDKNSKSQTLDILNTVENTNLTWSLSNIPPWLTVSSAQGTATLQNKSSVVLTADDSVADGKYTANLLVSSNGGSKQVTVTYSHIEAAQVKTTEVKIDGGIAKAFGNVVLIGNNKLSAYGFCWAKSADPTLADSHNDLGEKTSPGTFESEMDDLDFNTTYYVRAYATHDGGTFYGETKVLTIPHPVETIQCEYNSFYLKAEGKTDYLGKDISDHGFVISTSANPPTSENATKVSLGSISTADTFSADISGDYLSRDGSTLHYIRAYVSYADGTTEYGRTLSFSLPQVWTRIADTPGGTYYPIAFVIDGKAYEGGLGAYEAFYQYDPDADTWTSIADFPDDNRTNAVAFVLDGKAYVGTGLKTNGSSKSFYRYDPDTNTWTSIADFPDDRYSAVAFVLEGKAYVGTGVIRTGYNGTDSVNDFYRYDPNTDTWTKIADFPNNSGYNVYSFVLEGKAYVGGGANSKNFYQYNPDTDTWTDGIANYSKMLIESFFFVLDGKAYAGGEVGFLYRYDPDSDTWTKIADLPNDGFTRPISFVLNGKAYVGQRLFRRTVYRFDGTDDITIIK